MKTEELAMTGAAWHMLPRGSVACAISKVTALPNTLETNSLSYFLSLPFCPLWMSLRSLHTTYWLATSQLPPAFKVARNRCT